MNTKWGICANDYIGNCFFLQACIPIENILPVLCHGTWCQRVDPTDPVETGKWDGITGMRPVEGYINSLAPGKFDWNFRHVLFKQILVIDGWGISCEIALIWMSLDFTDDQSILVQVMAWCHQATSHYLSQCWSRSLLPYGVTRPEWVNSLWLSDAIW